MLEALHGLLSLFSIVSFIFQADWQIPVPSGILFGSKINHKGEIIEQFLLVDKKLGTRKLATVPSCCVWREDFLKSHLIEALPYLC